MWWLSGSDVMTCLKSTVVDIAAAMLSLIMYGAALIAYISLYLRPRLPNLPSGGEVSFDLTSVPLLSLWLPLVLAGFSFAAGFYWMFTRAIRQN